LHPGVQNDPTAMMYRIGSFAHQSAILMRLMDKK
jgi:hypothetical protein